jgi:3-oxoacyl-[acyl-carrier protein] reductase
MVDKTRLAGKVVFVTGGGSGLGRGVSLRLADEGAAVAVADIRKPLADAVAEEITAAGGRALAVQCNVADEDTVARAVAEAVARFGTLTGLFANAGTSGSGWIHETSVADWNAVLSVNLTGVFISAKHCIPHMIAAGGGSVVVTSSIAGSVIGSGGSAASYAVSKHGVIGLAKQIAVDYAPQNIRANAIQPAGIQESNLGKHAREDRVTHTTPRAQLPRGRAWLLVKRAGHPRNEYGATVAFLLSDEAAFITGTSIAVDGGYLAT